MLLVLLLLVTVLLCLVYCVPYTTFKKPGSCAQSIYDLEGQVAPVADGRTAVQKNRSVALRAQTCCEWDGYALLCVISQLSWPRRKQPAP